MRGKYRTLNAKPRETIRRTPPLTGRFEKHPKTQVLALRKSQLAQCAYPARGPHCKESPPGTQAGGTTPYIPSPKTATPG
ncbi:hypothetical protein SCFA_1350006 [anaerobic digester metagenome]|uniref:Uncharacterized protein n=1 Tax=anaerobic digester metagenome TaxID=1263854 RepID=A0A485LXF9_9ZZZZ